MKNNCKWYLHSPWCELMIMTAVFITCTLGIFAVSFSMETPPGGTPAVNIAALITGFFLLSFAIACISALAGIGGGVLFTPILLAFTPIDSLVVRATGLIVAMFGGLISSGPFMRSGLGNLRMSVILSIFYGTGAFAGAQGAIYCYQVMGLQGEALIRIILGVLVALIAFYFLIGGVNLEWPQIDKIDRFTEKLQMPHSYYEQSLGRVVSYRVKRAGWASGGILFVGAISGFFGLGAGWAIVPLQNVIMGAPLKVAAANSAVLIGMGDCVAVWPYLLTGSVIPLFAAPWLAGKVMGGLVGALLLVRVKAWFVRIILIGLLFFTVICLFARGLEMLGFIGAPPGMFFLGVLIVIAMLVARTLVRQLRAEHETRSENHG